MYEREKYYAMHNYFFINSNFVVRIISPLYGAMHEFR
jgi:hypothetical protein